MGKLLAGKSDLLVGIVTLVLGILLVVGLLDLELVLGIALIAYGAIKVAASI